MALPEMRARLALVRFIPQRVRSLLSCLATALPLCVAAFATLDASAVADDGLQNLLQLAETTPTEPAVEGRYDPWKGAIDLPPTPPSPSQLAGIHAALGDASADVRRAMLDLCVIKGWGRWLSPAQVIPHLKSDPDMAAMALAQMGPRGALFAAQLLPLLRKKDPSNPIHGVVRALAAMGNVDPAAASLVAAVLDSPEAGSIRGEAIHALGNMGANGAFYAAKIGAFLDAPNAGDDVRGEAISALGAIGKKGEPYAGKIAAFLDGPWRGQAALALGQWPESSAPFAARVALLLQDPDVSTAGSAALTLGRMGGKAAPWAPKIAALLANWDLRPFAIHALVEMSRADAAAPICLLPLLKDSDLGVRDGAISALGQMGAAAAPFADRLFPLVDAASEDDPAISALRNIGAALPPKTEPFFGNLVKFLESPEPGRRFVALVLLGRLGDPDYAPKIAPLLEDDELLIQAEAARTLALLGKVDPATTQQTAPLLRNEDRDTRKTAVEALGRMGRNALEFVPQIEALLQDADVPVRVSAAAALCRLRCGDRLSATPYTAFVDNSGRTIFPFSLQTFAELGATAAPLAGHLTSYLATRPADFGEPLAIFRALIKVLGPDPKVQALAAPYLQEPIFQDTEEGFGCTSSAYPDTLPRILDDFSLPPAGEARDIWFISVLEGLLTDKPEGWDGPTILRAHIRLWCADDERLQRALDWVGKPDPAPDPGTLSPAARRLLLATLSGLWETAVRAPERRPPHRDSEPMPNASHEKSPRTLVFNELAGGIERLAAAAAVPAKPDPELAAILRKLCSQCASRERLQKALDRALQRANAD